MVKVAKKVANDNSNDSKKVSKLGAKVTKISAFEFKIGDFLVYPTHGVGKVNNIETTVYAGIELTAYVLYFEKEKMTLRVPVKRVAEVGLRKLSSEVEFDKAVVVLRGKPKTGRGMWSRRATEYGAKINSGNIESIAQVVRDLHKNVDDPDRSYSERMIYESAFDRLVGEFAAVNSIDLPTATEKLIATLNNKRERVKEKEKEVAKAA
jgi:CarD family transcriptional regulator